jgi:UDP-N-acetylmuramate--alanine ligase
MLVEACEYRANFLGLVPQMAVLLGIEPDHFDCFAHAGDLERAFADFARRVPSDGLVLWSGGCAATRRVVRGLDCACESFGLAPSATWHATSVRERRGFYSFQIRSRDRLVANIALNVPGKHNVINALAAAAVASHCGATGKAMHAGLERFAGLERRIELLCDGPGAAIVDDYAHHPTEVAATLATVRQMYPDRRVWCVFEPHQTLRTRKLMDEFARSLQNADTVIVAPIFGAREAAGPDARKTATELARRVAELGAQVEERGTLNEIEDYLSGQLAHADVLVTIGAGDIGTVAHGLRHRFRTFRKAG